MFLTSQEPARFRDFSMQEPSLWEQTSLFTVRRLPEGGMVHDLHVHPAPEGFL
jgi:hypothetical protein